MKQYAPRIQVMHYGLVSGTGTRDITDWLGEGSQVRTSKSIREPMGQFSIVFADKMISDAGVQSVYDQNDADASLYAIFAPMDAIEIRVSHDGSQAPKLIMRGFISDVRREKSMGPDGRPVRRVVIIGHDVGKLMMMHRIIVFPCDSMAEAALNLSGFGVLLKYFGDAMKTRDVAEFAGTFAEILNVHLQALTANSALLGATVVPAVTAEGGIPSYPALNLNDVTYHQFMSFALDVGPFNELFTRDVDGGVSYLVVRPCFSAPDGIVITEEDVQSYQVHRTDANIGNWFWANQMYVPMVDNLTQKIMLSTLGCDVGDARQWDSCHEAIYGWRKMEATSRLFPVEYSGADAPREKTLDADTESVYEWVRKRIQFLRDNNVYNALHEDAVFRIAGNEHAEAGTWIPFTEGSVPSRHYCHRVEHEFQVYGNYFTTLFCDKGTGYLARKGGSHYKAELNLKGALK